MTDEMDNLTKKIIQDDKYWQILKEMEKEERQKKQQNKLSFDELVSRTIRIFLLILLGTMILFIVICLIAITFEMF